VYYRRTSFQPALVGLIASLALLFLYLGLVSLISGSWSHALQLVAEDRWFVLPITLGFGIQAGLFTYLRSLHRLWSDRFAGSVQSALHGRRPVEQCGWHRHTAHHDLEGKAAYHI
jgi:hypothetical protein